MKLFFLLLIACSAFGADFAWHGLVPPGQTIEIKGVNGSIVADAATSAEVSVTADKTARQSDPQQVQIVAVPHAGGVTVCAVYPSKAGARPNECVPGNGGHMSVNNNDVKVNFAVHVPAGVQLVAQTVNGGVTAEGLRSDVDAHTVNGSVRVSTSEMASAHTVNGSIHAAFGQVHGDRLDFGTVNGSVVLTAPATLSANLHASLVNGSVQSDLPIVAHGRLDRRHVEGKIGNGGPDLTIKTVNGNIELNRR